MGLGRGEMKFKCSACGFVLDRNEKRLKDRTYIYSACTQTSKRARCYRVKRRTK